MKPHISYDVADLVFRLLFSLIFIGLGMEHFFADDLIRAMMPDWVGSKRIASVIAGIVSLGGGISVATGRNVRQAAMLLGAFLVVVTAVVHAPALFHRPADLPSGWTWLWDVYQRSNFFKNLCLLGVCFQLMHHRVGRYSWGRKERDSQGHVGR